MPDNKEKFKKRIQGNQPFMTCARVSIAILFTLLITGCATPPPHKTYDGASASLAEASYSVSRSLVNLSEIAQAGHPVPDLSSSSSPPIYGMTALTSIDWSGPVEPLVRQIARASNYRVRVLGRPPAIPVLVSIYDKNRMISDVLRDVGFQCGRRATLVVYPDERVIELRYAQN